MRIPVFATASALAAIVATADPAGGLNLIHPALAAGAIPDRGAPSGACHGHQ